MVIFGGRDYEQQEKNLAGYAIVVDFVYPDLPYGHTCG